MKFHVSKWIFILFFTNSSGFMLLRINSVNKEQLSNFYNLLRNEANSNDHNHNNIVFRVNTRKNFDVREFKNKVLVKRNIPHGYKTLGCEYDEKYNTLYKPLYRVHKNKRDNYDIIFILEEDNIESFLNDLSLLQPMYQLYTAEVQKFTGENIEDVISEFITHKRKHKHADISLLTFGEVGMIKAKQFKELYPKKTLRNELKNVGNTNFDKQDGTDRDDKFIEDIIGIVIHERKKDKTQFRNAYDPDDIYNKLDIKDTKTRNLIKDNNNRLHWFGPVGYMNGKHSKGFKKRAAEPFRTHIREDPYKVETKLLKTILEYPRENKEQNGKPKQFRVKKIQRTTKSNEELDPLTPQKLYINEDNDITTPKPKKWLPKYSFWDFWTYDKTLYQDECKGDLVRLGEVCVALPPH